MSNHICRYGIAAYFNGAERVYFTDRETGKKKETDNFYLYFIAEEVMQYPNGVIMPIPLEMLKQFLAGSKDESTDEPSYNKRFKVHKDVLKKLPELQEGKHYWIEFGVMSAQNFKNDDGRDIAFNKEILLDVYHQENCKKRLHEIAQMIVHSQPQQVAS